MASSGEQQVATEVRQKPGPLQDIFSLPPDEVVLHSCSCALERSFLYHGRMYMSAHYLAFHSNVFAKKIRVVLPLEDIEELRKSLHALINPAITIILRAGSGGHGVPPLSSPDGRPKYKLTSFWNRGHIFRILRHLQADYSQQTQVATHSAEQTLLRVQSSRSSHHTESEEGEGEGEERTVSPQAQEGGLVAKVGEVQPFLDDKVLHDLLQVTTETRVGVGVGGWGMGLGIKRGAVVSE